jgi:small subunit ribosomal protein S3Ae
LARRKGRVKDKWREKKWVTVNAPDSFNNVPIAYVPITDDENASGRVLEVTLYDILKGDPSQHQYKMYFQLDKVQDEKASSIFKRFEYSKEFLRSLVRRGSSKINFIIDVKTKDGYIFRIKVIALTHRQLNTSRKHALRLIARDIINKTVPEMTIDQFVQATCYGKINSDIMVTILLLLK